VSPKVVYWLYTAVIRPMIAYAAVVWWPRVTYSTVAKQLEHGDMLRAGESKRREVKTATGPK